MSLIGVLRTGVSGMNAQSNRISTVAENIQNSSTTGYKRSSTEFSSLLIEESASGNYNSGSVETTVRRAVTENGTIAATNSKTDIAIDGNGFFVVKDATDAPYLTRSGNFVVDGTTLTTGGATVNGDDLAWTGTLQPGQTVTITYSVTVGDDATTGAGSIITEDVPAEALAIARARQVTKEHYAKRKRDV